MRSKELHMLKLVSCLMENKKLKLTAGEGEPSLYSKYKGQDGDPDLLDKRTLQRYVAELCEMGIFQKTEQDYYIVTQEYMKLTVTQDIGRWPELMQAILDSGEFETYVMLRKYLTGGYSKIFLDDMELRRYARAVKESADTLRCDKAVIRHINYAIEKNCRICVEYKGKSYSILPICYVMSKDGIRTYLYYERRRRLETPMDLQYVKFISEEKIEENINREEFMQQVKEAWDIEVGKKVRVKLLVRHDLEEKEDYDYVWKILKEYLGNPIIEEDNYSVFCGEISGIDDFKAWLRRYIDICIVQEPVALRDELMRSLEKKIERYEVE